jgi:AraC-like DNA-binding protein
MNAALPLEGRHVLTSPDPGRIRDAVARLSAPHEVSPRRGKRRIAGLVAGIALPRVSMLFVRYGADVRVEVPGTGARLVLTFPLGPIGVEAQGVRTAAFALADDHRTVMAPDPWAGAIVLAAPLAALEDHLRVLVGAAPVKPLRFIGFRDAEPILPGLETDDVWRSVARQLDTAGPDLLAGPVGRHLEHLLLGSMLLGFPHTASDLLREPPGPSPGPAHLEAARAYLEAHYADPLTVADVARAASVSVRGLQYGFREHFDATPTEILREIRLRHARAALRDGATRGPCTVASVATGSGYTNPGRFARDYRRRFGEPPSKTLRDERLD